MAIERFRYVIVGGGLAGASAVEGIREEDSDGSILVLGAEPEAPYHRPPLTKDLWTGDKEVEDIFVHDEDWYGQRNVALRPRHRVTALEPAGRTVTSESGAVFGFEKLLLATGGAPRRLEVEGGGRDEILYFRTLADYRALRRSGDFNGLPVVVVGGSFIGSEIAAALSKQKADVTMVFPESLLCERIFPRELAEAVTETYRARGITIRSGDAPEAFLDDEAGLRVRTREGRTLPAATVVAGIGITPRAEIAREAGLGAPDGIAVNAQLRTEHADIYAAGDVALFRSPVFEEARRVEHWDNAQSQGRLAGRNMAGAGEAYDYLPFFFSDLFDLGYEAVGEVNSELETQAFWEQEFETGVVYYLEDDRVRGVLLCNVWEKVDAARELIRSGRKMSAESLRDAITGD
jgi:NADPH-dependent 2,4-dienoyl-CoA reductase/sulfur reductase-like enzyme